MSKRILILSVLALAFFGCMEDGLNIKIKYDQIHGLQEGARVFFEENHIGDVTGISYTKEGCYLLDVVIKRNFVFAATENSAFIIIADPREKDRKGIEMIRAEEGGEPLKDGTIVEGTTRSSLFLGKVREKFDRMFDGLKRQFERFADKLREIPDKEEIRKLEREIERLADELRKAEKAAREKIKKEVIPRLKRELEDLRERLRKSGREKEVEPLEVQIEKITKI